MRKVVSSIPSSAARWFMRATKLSALPAMCSARATAASLPEATHTALRRSSTLICSFSFRYTWDPPMEAA